MTSTSLQGFLQTASSVRSGTAAAQVYLAAFGKHPGWNDHIDDLGFETDSLVIAKRFIYLEGIASQIDTGAWDRLDPAARFGSFDHYLLWQRGTEILCAVIVDSRDGKGRTRYPMVLCLHAIGVALDRVTAEFAPVLDRSMRECMAVTTADAVHSILDVARTELRHLLAGSPTAPPSHVSLVDNPALGAGNEGLFRLLYQVKNQFSSWTRGGVDYEDHEALPRPASLRAPQVATDFSAGAGAWMDFFRSQLGEEPPVLLLWPRSAPWFDAIVGAPDPAAFFALKAGAGAIPLATEVPYQFDDAFRAEALAVAAEFPRGAKAEKTIFGPDFPGTRKRKRTGLRLDRAKRAMAEGGRSVSGWWSSWSPAVVRALIVVFLVLVLGVTGLIYWATRTVEDTPVGTPSAPGAARGVDPATLTAWQELCAASYEWFGRLGSELRDPARRARWKQDPGLRTRVIGPIETHEARLAGFSPQQLTGTSGAAQTLRSIQPAALAQPEVALKVRQAAELVADIGRALREWDLLGHLEALTKRLNARGWSGPGAELAAWRASVQLDGQTARAVDDLLARQADLKVLSEKLDEIEGWAVLTATPDPFLNSWVEAAAEEARAAVTVAELRESLVRRTEGLAEVVTLLRDPSLDQSRLAAESTARFDPAASTAAQVKSWLERARGLTKLPAGERPLPESGWDADTASLRRALSSLQQLSRGENLAEPAAALDELDRRYAAFRQQSALRRDLPRLRELAASLESDRVALTRRLEADIGRRTNPAAWIAALRESTIPGSAVASAEWVRRRESLVAGADASQGVEAFLVLQRAATRTEDFLRAAARAEELPTQLHEAKDFDRVVHRRREAALEELLRLVSWADGQPEKSWAEFIAQPAALKVMAEFRRQIAEFVRIAGWTDRLARHFDSAADWAKLAVSDRDPPEADADVLGLPRVEAVVERLGRVRRVAESSDRVFLAREAQAGDMAVAMQAWRALGRLADWPAGAAELLAEQQARDQLEAQIARLGDARAKPALTGELQAEGRRRWMVAAGRAHTDPDWHELFSCARASGVDVAALGARERYNEWLWRAKQAPWRTFGTEEFAARRSALSAELAKLPEAARKVEPWWAEFERISTTDVSIDLSKVGPGAAGWKLVDAAETDMLSFTWTAAGAKAHQRLDFRLLEGGFERPVYLATTEVPVGLFLEWCEARNLWTDLLAPMRDLLDDARANPNQEIRRGPRVFTIVARSNKLALASSWIARAGYYPANGAPPPPDIASPVNYLAPASAELFARSLNCRLPAVAEWQSAWRTMQDRTLGTIPAILPNRRDATWQRQADFVATQEAGREKIPPDEDAYLPPTVFVIPGIVRPAAVKEDDGTLWFRAVDRDAPGKFLNLAGNVAEFALDPSKSPAAQVVIGASALSVAEVEVATPYPAAARAYSDVGLRLAFTIDRLTPGQRAAQILHDAAYRR